MKNALKLAVCGISTALTVVLLFFGGITMVLAYIMPMLTGALMIILRRSLSTSSAWITYASASVLSFILVTDKECALMYIFFFGFYPIIQIDINKIKNSFLRTVLKLVLFNAMIISAQLVLCFVFHIPFIEEGIAFMIIFMVLMNVLFVVYDILLNKLNLLYKLKLEKRINKYFK